MDYKTAVKKARSLPDFELQRQVSTLIPMAEEHIAAKLELARRERRSGFWRQHLVAWLALGLATISLAITILDRTFPRGTVLEKECSAWAENTMREMRDPDRSRYALLLGACMKGGR